MKFSTSLNCYIWLTKSNLKGSVCLSGIQCVEWGGIVGIYPVERKRHVMHKNTHWRLLKDNITVNLTIMTKLSIIPRGATA